MHDLARQQLPETLDAKLANAEIQRRRLEVDTLKWTFARMQPKGIRNRSEDTQADNVITLSWGDYKPPEHNRDTTVLTLVENKTEDEIA